MAKVFTNLAAAVSSNVTKAISLASTSGMAVGDVLIVGDKQMQVNAIPVAGTAKVQRGMNGTRASNHASLEGAVFGDPDDFRVEAGETQLVKGGGVGYDASAVLLHTSGQHNINVAGVGTMTLAVPDAADEGKRIDVVSSTAQAHVLTVTGGHGGGGASFDVHTFSAVGDSVSFKVQNALWCLISNEGVVIT